MTQSIFKIGQNTCYKCNKTDYSNRFETTTDNKQVCMMCLRESQDYYKKGLLSSEEIDAYYADVKNYKEKVGELNLLIRKYAKHNNETPTRILKEVLELETSLSETSFKKGLGFGHKTIVSSIKEINGVLTATMKERIALTKQIIENFDLIRKTLSKEELKKVVVNSIKSNGDFNKLFTNNYYTPYTI